MRGSGTKKFLRHDEKYSSTFHPLFGHINRYQFINKNYGIFLKANLFMCKKPLRQLKHWAKSGMDYG